MGILRGVVVCFAVMRLQPTSRLCLALLLALILPLQAFAAVSGCSQLGVTQLGVEVNAVSGADTHCAHGAAAAQHHNCGSCCCVAAIAGTPLRWIAPASAAPKFSMPLIVPPPAVALDRLDRPPR
jgi:hypothetical protein